MSHADRFFLAKHFATPNGWNARHWWRATAPSPVLEITTCADLSGSWLFTVQISGVKADERKSVIYGINIFGSEHAVDSVTFTYHDTPDCTISR